MNQEEFRTQVVTHMATANTRLSGIDARLKALEGKVDTLSTDGCAKGGENERRLNEIRSEPKKQAVGGAVAGGGIAAVLMAVAKIAEAIFAKGN